MTMSSLSAFQKEVHARNVEKGFYDYKADLAFCRDRLSDAYEEHMEDAAAIATLGPLQRLLDDYEQLQIERKLLLVIGELCEAHNELRSGHKPTEVYYTQQYKQCEDVHMPGATIDVPTHKKPEGFGVETADAHIRLLDLEEALGIKTAERIKEKHEFNGTRSYRHGKRF